MTNSTNVNLLLLAGIAAAALFFVVTAVEIFLRPGFSITKHAISVLSLGERGWLMVGTFIVSGLLTVLFASGVWQTSAPLFGTLLLLVFGVGLAMAGIFPAPAGMGFPPGTPADMQPVMDRGAVLHSVAFMVAFSALIIASFVMGIHFWLTGNLIPAVVLLVAGVAMPLLIGLGMASIVATGVAFYIASLLAWLVVVVIAVRQGGWA